jgi:SNF2 family DNA or RNA helicase
VTTPTLSYPRLAKIKSGEAFYRHQVEGINRLMRQQNFLLADDMGLGKTLQALTVAAIDFERGVASRILVVCLASIKYNWLDEIELRTNYRAMVLQGTPDKRYRQMQQFMDEDYDILIVNYEQVLKHVGDFNDMAFDIVIYDEAHSIKNPRAKRTRACMGLIATRYFALTGSPMLNRVNELWTILHRLDPASFPRYWAFVQRYCIFGGYEGREIVGTKNQKELREKIGPLMLRRLKKDVLDLPEKQRIQEWLDLTPAQTKMYKQAEEELRIEIPGQIDAMNLESTLTKFLRLKQICSTTHCLDPESDDSSKLDRLEEIIDELLIDNGEPLVIFTQFRGTLDAIEKRLARKRIRYSSLHGDVKIEERQQRIRAWTNDAARGRPGALVCMLQVAGVGLNLTAASTVIFVDKLYVPKLNEQAEDRVHRIGVNATKPVRIIELLCRGTVERRIERLLRRKDIDFNDIIEGANYDDKWKRKLIQSLLDKEDE